MPAVRVTDEYIASPVLVYSSSGGVYTSEKILTAQSGVIQQTSGSSLIISGDFSVIAALTGSVFTGPVSFSSGSNQLGTLEIEAGNLKLSAENLLNFSDVSGSIFLSSGSSEWAGFASKYGAGSSIIGALNSASPDSSARRVFNTEIASASFNLIITSSVNWPAALDMTGGKSDVFVNGLLQLEGSGKDFIFASAGSDSAKITFSYELQIGDVIRVTRYPYALM